MRNRNPKFAPYRKNIFFIISLVVEAMLGVGLLLFMVSIANPENGFFSGFGLVMALFLCLPLWMMLVGATLWWFHSPDKDVPPFIPPSGGDEL